jgi:hypothetical protein
MTYTAPTTLAESKRWVDFPAKDAKGRTIGAHVYRSTVRFDPVKDGQAGYRHLPGVYEGLRVQATRNGLPYGASQSWRYFDTAEARDAALAKYLRDAQRRAEAK